MITVRAALTSAFAAALVLSGCSTGMSEYDLAQAEYEDHLEDRYEPTEEQLQAEGDAASEQYLAESSWWDCFYDPTFNDDWHDDVVCLNGADSLRPILLPELGFVTEEEMIAAGEAYEAGLNSTRSDQPSWVSDPTSDQPSWTD